MALKLGSAVVDALLLGPESRRRQLQDLPVLGDVWTEYAAARPVPPDLLLLPAREKSAVDVARLLIDHAHNDDRNACAVAYLHDLVVASLAVADLVEAVFPATLWWDQIERRWGVDGRPGKTELERWISDELGRGLAASEAPAPASADPDIRPCIDTADILAARLGLILGLFLAADRHDGPAAAAASLGDAVSFLGAEAIVARGVAAVDRIKSRYRHLRTEERTRHRDCTGTIFQVTLNRAAEPAVAASVPAIKADAARQLFTISCAKITFAIIDSGIDHRHEAFGDQAEIKRREAAGEPPGPTGSEWRPHRIKAAFDFTRVRAILGVRDEDGVEAMAKELSAKKNLKIHAREIRPALAALVADGAAGRPVDWGKVRPLIELELGPAAEPAGDLHPHGTHVAGILGADWQRGDDPVRGVCPDIALIDCRVLGSELGDSEFAVSAALQFIRFYNEQGGNRRINGVNMSLAIRHNVRNYACGRTPVCLQAEALVANGVVVVAAAGNRGYQQYQLADSSTFEGYAASSITDPGNADGVITVGSTHRHWPHTYGVSFFSSRGPTGDGRLKPDLLAPGEKIVSCVPGGRDDQMDGTSMAAPHVAGAAALLMARHEELKGQPARIKQILCATATDLGRERSFQGHGMVDVLRAIQAV